MEEEKEKTKEEGKKNLNLWYNESNFTFAGEFRLIPYVDTFKVAIVTKYKYNQYLGYDVGIYFMVGHGKYFMDYTRDHNFWVDFDVFFALFG